MHHMLSAGYDHLPCIFMGASVLRQRLTWSVCCNWPLRPASVGCVHCHTAFCSLKLLFSAMLSHVPCIVLPHVMPMSHGGSQYVILLMPIERSDCHMASLPWRRMWVTISPCSWYDFWRVVASRHAARHQSITNPITMLRELTSVGEARTCEAPETAPR